MNAPTSDAKTIFGRAIEIEDSAARVAYLDQACGSNDQLRAEIDSLVRAHFKIGNFLKGPAHDAATCLNDADPGERGMVIGPYKLLEPIGEGGMGVVYMADQVSPVRRRVALKIIKPGMDTRQVLARFEAERQALALMDHPNIAKVLDAGATDSGRPYFVMELVRGVPVTEYCDKNNLSIRERLELFGPICQAVQHAHQKGIIHRDLKPTNVLVTLHDGTPVPKVIDFGVAKATNQQLTEKTLFTSLAQMIGTPLYMSPEQAEMSGLDVDTRSDIYSLGVLLYELLTGTTPFDSKRLNKAAIDEVRRIIREEEPPKPSTRLSSLGDTRTVVAGHRRVDPARLHQLLRGDLDWIVMKALEKDRTRRYETANGMARDVQRYLSDQPVEACPPSTAYRFRKFARRNRAVLSTAAIVALALIAGIVISTWQAVRATVAEKAARSSEQVAEDEKREADLAKKQAEKRRDELAIVNDNLRRVDYVADMNLARMAWDENNLVRTRELLERYVPERGSPDLRGFEWHYLRRLMHGDFLTLDAHEGSVTDVAFMRDGQLLTGGTKEPYQPMPFSKSAVGQLKLWDPKTGTPVDLKLKGLSETAKTVVLSRDGRYVAATCNDGLIRFWDRDSGEPIVLAAPGKWTAHGIRFAPDGLRLVSVYQPPIGNPISGAYSVLVWDLVARKCVMTVDGLPFVRCAEFSPDNNQLAICLLNQGVVKVVNIKTSQEAYRCKYGDNTMVEWATFSPDGKRLFACGGKGIRVWNVAARDTAASWPAMTIMGRCFAFSPNGTRLATAGVEGVVELRDSATGNVVHRFKGHSGSVEALAFNPDGTRLASGGLDGTVRLWETTDRVDGASNGRFPSDAKILELSPDGQTLLTGAKGTRPGLAGKSFRLWDTSTFQQKSVPVETPEIIGNYDWSGDSDRLFLSDVGNTITIVDVAAGRVLKKLHVDRAGTTATAVAGDAQSYAYCAPGGVIRLRDMKTGTERGINRPDKPVSQLALNLAMNFDGSRLASADENGDVRVWDTATGLPTATIKLKGVYVMRLRFSRDGRHLAIVGNLSRFLSGEVRIVDSESGSQIPLKGHTLNVFDCAFSPDGRRLATTSADMTIRLWDLATGQEVLKLAGYASWIRNIRFDAEGHRLIGAAADQIHLWDATPLGEAK